MLAVNTAGHISVSQLLVIVIDRLFGIFGTKDGGGCMFRGVIGTVFVIGSIDTVAIEGFHELEI